MTIAHDEHDGEAVQCGQWNKKILRKTLLVVWGDMSVDGCKKNYCTRRKQPRPCISQGVYLKDTNDQAEPKFTLTIIGLALVSLFRLNIHLYFWVFGF